MWHLWSHDARTGDPQLEMFPSGGSWERRLNGGDSWSADIPLRKQGIDPATARALLQPNNRMLSVRRGDDLVAGGCIETTVYKRTDGLVSPSVVSPRVILRNRLTFNLNNYVGGDLKITSRSASGAARAILSRAMQWAESWILPIDLPADGAGDFSADWKNYQILTIDDLLQQVEDEGNEVDFLPYLTGGQLRFQTRVGAPISSGSTDLPVTAPESPVTDLQVTFDGSKQLSGVFYAGAGSEKDMVTNFAWFIDGPGMVNRDASRTDQKDVRDPAKLAKIAMADLVAHRAPIEQWSFNIQVSDELPPSRIRPGTVLRMDVRGDDWIPDGVYTHRVIAISGTFGSDTVKVEVQPHGG